MSPRAGIFPRIKVFYQIGQEGKSEIKTPPHTWGTLPCLRQVCHAPGITPAYAGNTAESIPWSVRERDHPRIRGEHRYVRHRYPRWPGSPPHTRGTLPCLRQVCHAPGITPAYAGTPSPVIDSLYSRRITLAYAGNTSAHRWHPTPYWDHPRIRGEHCQRLRRMRNERGSPPHTRGTLASNPHHLSRKGITPAYAGNTLGAIEAFPGTRDHPRISGEHKGRRKGSAGFHGSPPHTRGTPSMTVALNWQYGSPPHTRGTH